MKKLVFVYGTLRRGRGNHHRLEGARYLGKAVTAPEFTMLHLGGFPGIVRSGNTAISGEVYEVTSQKMLASLDRLESHPNFYRREPITVTADGGQLAGDSLQVEAYVLPETWLAQGCEVVTSGIWR